MKKFELLDSVAVSKTLMVVEQNITQGGILHELDVREILKSARREISPVEYKDESFGAISASGPNAALPHYGPSLDSNRQLKIDETFLLDSGAQYLGCTTDITRTIVPGVASEDIKEKFSNFHILI